jgi:hypothetical protein
MSLLAGDGPEILGQRRFAVLSPVGHRVEDVVAFVTLHVLEVLDEQRLALCLCLLAVELDKLIIGPQAASATKSRRWPAPSSRST